MRPIRHILICIGAVAALLVLAAPALASPQAVIRDCAQDGRLDRQYSLKDLKAAEKKLPTDVDEYTNCRDVINQAEVAGSRKQGQDRHQDATAAGGGSGGGGGGGSPNDAKALDATKHGEPPTLSLHGEKVTPGSSGVFKTAGAANGLPLPVLLALIAVGALTAAGGFVALRRRFPEVVGAALRIFRR